MVELLVASVVLVLILGAIAAYLATSARSFQLTEDISDRQQEIEAAVNVLSYDLALAGYKGVTPTDVARTFTEPTVVVSKDFGGSASDRLQVRYFEDAGRLFGADNSCGSPCLVTYQVDVDASDGLNYLFRQEGSSTERGIVQAVEHFRVISYLNRDGSREPVVDGTVLPDELAGLNIEILFSNGGLWRFPVGISNRQTYE